jgi:hypothetical protein
MCAIIMIRRIPLGIGKGSAWLSPLHHPGTTPPHRIKRITSHNVPQGQNRTPMLRVRTSHFVVPAGLSARLQLLVPHLCAAAGRVGSAAVMRPAVTSSHACVRECDTGKIPLAYFLSAVCGNHRLVRMGLMPSIAAELTLGQPRHTSWSYRFPVDSEKRTACSSASRHGGRRS